MKLILSFPWTLTYELNDIGPGGGIVYYVDGSGEHGLEAWPADEFSPTDYAPLGTYNFPNNLAFILAKLHDVGVVTGWHLPTKTELELMYEQQFLKNFVGGFSFTTPYWSSTKVDANIMWYQKFNSGDHGTSIESTHYRVRAVRIF